MLGSQSTCNVLCPQLPGGGPCLAPAWWQTQPCLVLPALPGAVRVLPCPRQSLTALPGHPFSPQNDGNLSGFRALIQQQESCYLLACDRLLSGSLQVASFHTYTPLPEPLPALLLLFSICFLWIIPLFLFSVFCWQAGATPSLITALLSLKGV